MDGKWTFLLGLTFIIPIVIIVSVVLLSSDGEISTNPGTQIVDLEQCKSLRYNGGDKIDILFFSSKSESEKYSDFLFNVAPLDELDGEFNVYYIDTEKPECELYKNLALFCYSESTIKLAASCPNDYIVVVDREEASIRSSSYLNVMSINSEHPLTVYPHEFGHSFANFAEEYIPAKLPRSAENCVAQCEDFEGEKEGCFDGCSKNDFKRSIDRGVMRTLSSQRFGLYNENIIRKRISSGSGGITGRAIDDPRDCRKESYYFIKAISSNEEIVVLERGILPGCVGGNGAGPYSYSIILSDGSSVSDGELNPDFIYTIAPGEGESVDGEVLDSDREFFIRLPVINEAERLDITNEGVTQSISLLDIGARPCRI